MNITSSALDFYFKLTQNTIYDLKVLSSEMDPVEIRLIP